MNGMQLHYIYDPLCGWCYAAAPLVAAARELLPVQLHGGGMMTGSRRQPVSAQLRDHVMPHDRRIAQLSGQRFGEAYFNGLLLDTTAVFDSAPPTTAVLAAQQVAGRGAEMLARIQAAHYQQGWRIADPQVLQGLAAELGIDEAVFAAAFRELEGEATQAHIVDSRHWLARVGGQGFPTMALERDGGLERIDLSAHLGRPEAFTAWLLSRLPAEQPGNIGCDPNGCSL